MTTPVERAIDNALPLAIGAAIVLGVAYFLLRKTVEDVAKGAAGLVTGNNAITENATNAAGEEVTAYEGVGFGLGTLGAATNAVSGGLFASLGQWIGDKAFNVFNPPKNRDNLTYMVIFPDGSKKAVSGERLDDKGYFTYSDGKRYRMAVNQANQQVAIAA